MTYSDAIKILLDAANRFHYSLVVKKNEGPEGCEIYLDPTIQKVGEAIKTVRTYQRHHKEDI